MLRHALRRLLWTLPTLIGVSVLSFLFLSFVPDPTDDPALVAAIGPDAAAAERRERFLDLPRFINAHPRDVRTRATEAMRAIAEDAPDADEARREIVRLGGAALPHVLPELDALAPEPRARVAMSLAPIAKRMRLSDAADASDEARAASFWSRFWDDRSIELREASVRTAVSRLSRYRSASRATDLIELDTFALDGVLSALSPPKDADSLETARALVEIAAHVTERDDRIPEGADLAEASAVVARWRAFWDTYRSDYITFSGVDRAGAVVLETRYGKWALGVVTLGFGKDESGVPVVDELSARAPTTLVLLFGAILLAYAAAIPLGAVGATRRGRRVDLVLALGVLVLYAAPTAVVASLVARVTGDGALRLGVAIVVLAAGLVAAPTRAQRSALALSLSQDYARAATARGASRARVVLVHGLRNALLPIVTLASLEAPMALGGAFVVERVFDLHGLGEATIRAVSTRDVSWLMAVSILAAAAAALFVIATDLAYAVIDPRLDRYVLARARRR